MRGISKSGQNIFDDIYFDSKMTEIVRNTDPSSLVTSRRHFEAVSECCAQSLPVATSVTTPLKIPAQFDKLVLSPSSRGNTGLQRRYSTAMSPLLPRYVPGVGGPWFTLTGALSSALKIVLEKFSSCSEVYFAHYAIAHRKLGPVV